VRNKRLILLTAGDLRREGPPYRKRFNSTLHKPARPKRIQRKSGRGDATTRAMSCSMRCGIGWKNGNAPSRIEFGSANGSVTMTIRMYSTKATYNGSGPVTATSRYDCK